MHLAFLLTAACLLSASAPVSTTPAPIILDNGAIRVEVDPALFSVTYVGLPGGRNFLETVPVDRAERTGEEWLDPGGVVTDLVPYDAHDAAIRRGPAEVVSHDSRSVILLGPESAALAMRLKKEIRLDRSEPLAVFKVTVLSTAAEARPFSVRNTVRIPGRGTLRIDREDGALRPLAGLSDTAPAVVKSNQYWLVPVPPTTELNNVILGAYVPKATLGNGDGYWTRRILLMPGSEADVPFGSTLLCLLDDSTRSYGMALQSALAPISASAPLVFAEEWRVKKRGR
jgi:hypothetical protein